jgi:hypothetical protein
MESVLIFEPTIIWAYNCIMYKDRLLIISGVAGLILGFLTGKTFLAHTPLVLLPWTVLGLFIAYCIKDRKEAIVTGSVYGFALFISYLVAGFGGSKSQIFGFIFLTLIIGLIGAVYGIIIFLIVSYIKGLVYKN